MSNSSMHPSYAEQVIIREHLKEVQRLSEALGKAREEAIEAKRRLHLAQRREGTMMTISVSLVISLIINIALATW
jgi:hypothetical protein